MRIFISVLSIVGWGFPFLGLTCPGSGAEPLLRDDLMRAEISSPWSKALSKGNKLQPTSDGLEISAAENTFAYIKRPLGADHIQVCCEIKPGNGISWCTSLFLYWGPGDWCQMGIIPRNNGSYYACVMTVGQAEEQDLDPCEFQSWQGVGIELGKDIIRFVSRADGRPWTTRLLLDRPERLKGPPRLLILGKGYGRGDQAPELANDYGVRGPFGISKVRRLVVRPLDLARVTRTAEERRAAERLEPDERGDKVLAAGQDPTYESVARVLPPLKTPREVVGVKDHPYELGVSHDGTIEMATPGDGWAAQGPRLFFEIAGTRFGRGGCTKRLLDGFLPIVLARWQYAGLNCEQTLFGWSEGLRDNAPLWGYVRLRIEAKEGTTVPVKLHLVPASPPFQAPGLSLTIPAGGSATVCYRVPSPLEGRKLTEISAEEFQRRLGEVKGAWTRLLNGGMKIDVPEQRVKEAYRAWLAYNFLNVDRVQDRYEIHDGGGFYEAVFGYSAALFCHALDLMGHSAEARCYLDSLLAFVQPNGLFQVNYGFPDQGALLLAFTEHYRLTGDRDWLKRVAPDLVRLSQWIVQARKRFMKPTAGKRPLTWGLIQARPYCDYGPPTFNYYGDAYACIGLEAAASLLEEIGLTAEARSLAKEAAAYRADILTSMDAAVFERGGLKILPMEPDTHRLLKSTRYRAGGYYGLVASMLLETGFLPPRDSRAFLVTEFLQKKNGLVLGLCEFDRGVDHAYTYGYWRTCLRRGEIPRVILGFYGSLAYGMGRDTYCGVEATQILTGNPTLTMPHTYSGTQQLRLLRMMLLHEEDKVLILGPALPRHWLAPGRQVEVRGAPTRFGTISYRIEAEQDRMIVRLDPPRRCLPQGIVLRLRTAHQRPIKQVEVNGKLLMTFAGEEVRLPPVQESVQIRVCYTDKR